MPDSALLIGNNGYGRASLTNAVHDAEDLARVLDELGFSVQAVTDADHETMDRAIDAFLDGIPQDGMAFFYFSGHGLQIEGGNYLLPVGFRARDRTQAKHRACSAEEILGSMEQSSSRLNIIVLDACRENPFRAVRGATKGLTVMHVGAGSIIAYATGPGMTAADNPEGRNGLYTTHLIEALRTPGLRIEDIFKRTTEGVVAASGHEQTPWTATCVVGEHVLCRADGTTGSPDLVSGAGPAEAVEPRRGLERFLCRLESAGEVELVELLAGLEGEPIQREEH